jgi:LysR family hydrogen peroxide-inducible transcriptional activator
MTLRELQYLVALAETRHFGRAADRCLITQPTLSNQIQQLERFLGVRLFERTNRRLEITPIGIRILAEARQLLASARAIEALARGARDPLRGRLSLGIIPTLAPYLLPWFLPAMHDAWPELDLALREDLTGALLRGIEAHELDAALLALPVHNAGLAGAGLTVEPLFVEPFRAILPRGHALAGLAAVPQAALLRDRLLLLDDGHCLRDQALALCQQAGADGPEETLRATSLETIRQMVAAGLGVSLMPLLAVQGAEDTRLVVRPFAEPEPIRRIGLIWRKTSPRGEAMRRLAALIREKLPAGPRPLPPAGRRPPSVQPMVAELDGLAG